MFERKWFVASSILLLITVLFGSPASAQIVPRMGPTQILTSVPTTPGEIGTACGQMPVQAPSGNAPAGALNAQYRGTQAFGSSRYEQAAREFWIAFALHPVLGRLNEFSQALSGMGVSAEPRLCAALLCLHDRGANDMRASIEARQHTANCAPPTPVPAPPPVLRPPFSLSPAPFVPPSAQAFQLRPPLVVVPRRSVMGYALPMTLWTASAATLIAGIVTGLSCLDANQELEAANRGQTNGWPRETAALAENRCLQANILLPFSLALAGGGMAAWFLLRPTSRTTLAPDVSPTHAGVVFTFRF